MFRGKTTCKVLKEVRRKIADTNGIPLPERECTHTGDCAGTCPYCESEVRYLERELSKRKNLGKAVAVAGIAVAAVMPAMAQTPENNNPANGPVKTADQNGPENVARSKTCDTFPMPGIVPQSDSSSTASADTVLIEYDVPDFAPDGMVAPYQPHKIGPFWEFPSAYGTFKSYLHRQLKANPELREWIRTKKRQKRRSSSGQDNPNWFQLTINPKGEVVDVDLRFLLLDENDERMNAAFFQILKNMPPWQLGSEGPQPVEMQVKEFTYRYLR
jgi:hypothetical protein